MDKRTNKQKVLNTFEGENAVLDFLNPDNAPYTPLVEVPDSLNPYRKNGVRIFAKLMSVLPLGNVKSLPAYNMLLEKKAREGCLPDTIIENSSGNTVFSLAVIGRLMGVPHTKAIVSHQVSRGKLNLLRFLGTEVVVNEEPICPDPNDKTSGIYKAKTWAKQNRWFNPGQYDNIANPNAHYRWTGPQVWEQTAGKVDVVSVGLGTTGSAVGLSKFLKEKKQGVAIVGVTRSLNNPVPGVRTSSLLQEIAFDWKGAIDTQEEVGTEESFRLSLELCRAGLLVGPSSGFALAGLLSFLRKSTFDEKKEMVAVFICPDSPLPYLDEYFANLDSSVFPEIENVQLLQREEVAEEVKMQTIGVVECSPQEVFNMVFTDNSLKVWSQLKQGKKIKLKKSMVVVDVRDAGDFADHHIPGSINVPFHDLDTYLKKYRRQLKNQTNLVFVCQRGHKSRLACHKANMLGLKSCSMRGGDIEWSALNLPRWRNENCVIKYKL